MILGPLGTDWTYGYVGRCLARSLACSLARSLARCSLSLAAHSRLLARSLAHSLARSLARSLACLPYLNACSFACLSARVPTCTTACVPACPPACFYHQLHEGCSLRTQPTRIDHSSFGPNFQTRTDSLSDVQKVGPNILGPFVIVKISIWMCLNGAQLLNLYSHIRKM